LAWRCSSAAWSESSPACALDAEIVPPSSGTLRTDTPLFVTTLVGVVLLVGLLNFVPALALGPIVEHLQLFH